MSDKAGGRKIVLDRAASASRKSATGDTEGLEEFQRRLQSPRPMREKTSASSESSHHHHVHHTHLDDNVTLAPLDTVDSFLYRAKLAEKAKRYEECVYFMEKVVQQKGSMLSADERNLLSVGFKNVVGTRRASWRTLYTLEGETKELLANADNKKLDFSDKKHSESTSDSSNTKQVETLRDQYTHCRLYRENIETEVKSVCQDLLFLLKTHVLPAVNSRIAHALPGLMITIKSCKEHTIERELRFALDQLERECEALTRIEHGEDLVFYFKMIGDFHRYLAEFHVKSDHLRLDESLQALGGYFIASEIALLHLAPTDPIRLGLAFNFSVFYYEMMGQPDRACQLAKNAYDQAIGELDETQQHTTAYKDSLLIMKLLRHNLSIWTSQ